MALLTGGRLVAGVTVLVLVGRDDLIARALLSAESPSVIVLADGGNGPAIVAAGGQPLRFQACFCHNTMRDKMERTSPFPPN